MRAAAAAAVIAAVIAALALALAHSPDGALDPRPTDPLAPVVRARRFFEGGNDYEIYSHPRTIGHAVEDANPMTTLKILSELFDVPCPEKLTPPGSH